jgi:mono/diheme cytochrome c family protein
MLMRSLAATTILLLVAVATAPALAAGDAEAGHTLARQWCTGCHIVDRAGSGPDTAPPFPEIARRNPQDQSWVRAWLVAPHPPMPNFNLTRREIDEVVAYLDSLARR